MAAVAANTCCGTANTGNCYPFGCFAYPNGVTYQQVYAAGAFAGPTTINSISFARTDAGEINAATYNIAFYYSPYASGTLMNSAAANRGTLLSNFGSYNLSGNAPQTLSFSGNAFTYDATRGSLLMQVDLSNISSVRDFGAFFAADNTGRSMSRLAVFSDGSTIRDNAGLVTTFGVTGGGAVPEPSTWAFMIVGFGAVGGALRHRSAVRTAVRFA